MRKFVITLLIVIVLASTLLSCTSGQLKEDNAALRQQLATSEKTINELGQAVASLNAQYRDLQSANEKLQLEYSNLTTKYALLKSSYDQLQATFNQSQPQKKPTTMENLSWADTAEFIRQDTTNLLPYIAGKFESNNYATTMRDEATRWGFRCAVVTLTLTGEPVHYYLNAFETTDRGLIYADCTTSDKIAYVQIGKPYGSIPLEAVISDYIACEGDPGDFWNFYPAKKTNSDLFSYDYYQDYRYRVSFYEQSSAAYQSALKEYDLDSPKWNMTQLDSWKKNLAQLEKELGASIPKPLGIVEKVELSWNQ